MYFSWYFFRSFLNFPLWHHHYCSRMYELTRRIVCSHFAFRDEFGICEHSMGVQLRMYIPCVQMGNNTYMVAKRLNATRFLTRPLSIPIDQRTSLLASRRMGKSAAALMLFTLIHVSRPSCPHKSTDTK